MTPPNYPMGVHRAGIAGQVLYLRLSPKGETEDVIAYQSTLFNIRGTDKALKTAASKWKKKPCVPRAPGVSRSIPRSPRTSSRRRTSR